MRLIDADEIVYESIDSCDTGRYESYYGTGILAVRKEDIDAMPSAQPERETGMWIIDPNRGQLICSNCTKVPVNKIVCHGNLIYDMTPIDKMMKFCPACGAVMSGRWSNENK